MAEKMSYNIWNDADIDQWLEGHCRDRNGEVEEPLAAYVKLALRKALMVEKSCLTPLSALPQNAPGWLADKWQGGATDFHSFTPNDELDRTVRHIVDWIEGALVRDAAWLKNTDEQGRPKKLLKLGTLARATAEADKAMRQLSAKFNAMAEGEGALEVVKEFDDGYVIVRLLTVEALQREGGMMGHCIGNGSYDRYTKTGDVELYSLRDPKNRAHVSFEVLPQVNALLQCKGKENKPPVTAYIPYVQEFITERKYQLSEKSSHTGLIEQDGVYYDIYNLPDGFVCEKALDLGNSNIVALPDNLTVEGGLDLGHTGITSLPDNLTVEGELYLSHSSITSLPDNLTVDGWLDLRHTGITSLPDNLTVEGSLNLKYTDITILPDDLTVGGDVTLPNGDVVKTVEEARKILAEQQVNRAPSSPAP